MSDLPSRPLRSRARRVEILPENEVFERRDLERKRESSRLSMRRLREERARLAAERLAAGFPDMRPQDSDGAPVDGNNSEE